MIQVQGCHLVSALCSIVSPNPPVRLPEVLKVLDAV
jgi:hypothetical protein